ncbi:ABC transporter ATP-binding protein [Actinocatenispora thailandica]|uniref:ABC transporter ATP-binding protein n=1 Tax=Actinocatenispora thailandica TaxID=227318 RepID=A0A7R7DRV6_9ACTN|nr:ATP-binding cassette domain-containing protein [Actinocatenispora thailandica]BCJ36392.1 ABC transporter ATP-binding protein [Actinocatenispora thailandica]
MTAGPLAGPGEAPGQLAAPSGTVIEVRAGAVEVGGRRVWQDVDVEVAAGEFVAVLGPNGVGKSTLLKAILGLQPLAAGRIAVLGAAPARARRSIGYLPQRRSFDASTRIRGVDLIRLGIDGPRWGLPLPGRRGRQRRQRVDELVELVGAGRYAHRPLGSLSGGEQQRILIAQALAHRPPVLLLDEPLDSLDLPNQAAVAALLDRICRDRGVAVVMVAHDVNPILRHLDRVVYLGPGGSVTGAPEQVLSSASLTALYGTPVEVLRTSDGRMVVVGQPDSRTAHQHRLVGG